MKYMYKIRKFGSYKDIVPAVNPFVEAKSKRKTSNIECP